MLEVYLPSICHVSIALSKTGINLKSFFIFCNAHIKIMQLTQNKADSSGSDVEKHTVNPYKTLQHYLDNGEVIIILSKRIRVILKTFQTT